MVYGEFCENGHLIKKKWLSEILTYLADLNRHLEGGCFDRYKSLLLLSCSHRLTDHFDAVWAIRSVKASAIVVDSTAYSSRFPRTTTTSTAMPPSPHPVTRTAL